MAKKEVNKAHSKKNNNIFKNPWIILGIVVAIVIIISIILFLSQEQPLFSATAMDSANFKSVVSAIMGTGCKTDRYGFLTAGNPQAIANSNGQVIATLVDRTALCNLGGGCSFLSQAAKDAWTANKCPPITTTTTPSASASTTTSPSY